MPIFIGRVQNKHLPDAVRLQIARALEKLDGVDAIVSVERFHGKHSDQQRRYWFAVIVPSFIAHCGYDGPSAKEDCHSDLMARLWPLRERANPLTGEIEKTRESLRNLDTAQMATLIESAWKFAAENYAMVIPSPREFGAVA